MCYPLQRSKRAKCSLLHRATSRLQTKCRSDLLTTAGGWADFRCGLAAGSFAEASVAGFLPAIGISI